MDDVQNTEMSPYAAAQLVTEWLQDTEFRTTRIAPQMMYQYVTAERIVAHRDVNGHWQIRYGDLEEWYNGYLARKRELASKAAPDRKSA